MSADAALDDGARPAEAESADMFGDTAVQTPGQDTPVMLQVVGRLQDAAVVLDDRDGQVRLQVVLEQRREHHPHSVPVLVTWTLPDQGSYVLTREWAESLATRMPAGVLAAAKAAGIETGTHHKRPVFRLLDVQGLFPTDPPPPQAA